MRIRTLIVSALTLSVCLAPLRGEEPAKTRASRIVGSVFGKPVTADDIGLSAPIDPARRFNSTDNAEWERMGRVMAKFGGPVLERFVVQQKIDATAEEISAFRRYTRKLAETSLHEMEVQLARVKKELTAPDQQNQDNADLEKERARLEQNIKQTRDAVIDDASEKTLRREFIVAWKVERELHRKYGGRVIWQQFGLEALDGRRLLFEEAEKKGDLKFDDTGVRRLFYYYANMQHTFVEAKYLEERPWFLGDGP
jgi:hypothetical protein